MAAEVVWSTTMMTLSGRATRSTPISCIMRLRACQASSWQQV